MQVQLYHSSLAIVTLLNPRFLYSLLHHRYHKSRYITSLAPKRYPLHRSCHTIDLALNVLESEDKCHTVVKREQFAIEPGKCINSFRGLFFTVGFSHYLLLGFQCSVEEVAE
uniref:Uncharacterized protein n=1 Tax=Hyaloperonospora arabidopsidis (strain Emoy2) TaxID=559515 RepID=M4B321_HYAAE